MAVGQNKSDKMSLARASLQEIQKDGRDIYHRVIKWIAVPALLAYLAFSLLNDHVAKRVNESLVVTFARDSLLKMS